MNSIYSDIPLTQSVIQGLLSWTTLFRMAGLWVVYKVVMALYYISPLHPLYSFPGPKLAAISYAYEAYYDFWLVGRYTWEIQRMHKQYGHIVRINPHELHCDDPSMIDEIYASGNRIRDKWQHMVNTASTGPVSTGTFFSVPHELHRRRRNAVSRYFSRAQMLKLEDEVSSLAHRVADKLLSMSDPSGNRPFNIREAFNCFTADIIAQYSFGEDMGFVAQEGTWEPNFASWTAEFFTTVYMRHLPPVRWLTNTVPLVARLLGGKRLNNVMEQMTVVLPGYIRNAKEEKETPRVFAELLDSPYLPPEDKSMFRLSGEGYTLLVAGTETTSAALAGLTYHLLSQPETLFRLRQDLSEFDMGDDQNNNNNNNPNATKKPLKWTDLEQRPYLWAVIQETLRLYPGVSTRSARIARDEDLIYHSSSTSSADSSKKEQEENTKVTETMVIPRGTPIGMSSFIQHHNEKNFPDPWSFIPERWLLEGGGGEKKRNLGLEKQLIAFGRGSRNCLGMQLALCELYLLTAVLALEVFPRARLYETGEDEVRYDYDLVVPRPKAGGKGVRVVIC